MNKSPKLLLLCLAIALLMMGVIEGAAAARTGAQGDGLTPIQREIEHQRQRLGSSEVEERRDALMRLGNLKRPDASRVAAAGLKDLDPMVRVTAAHAVLSLPPAEAASLLIPLLQDKGDFVRREAAYALGETRSQSAVSALLNQLVDKEAGVRGAIAVALGQIGDEAAVSPLSQLVAGVQPTGTKKKAKGREDSFVMRAAARSLGQIRSRAAVSALVEALANEVNDIDVRREAATSLGLIGDKSAESALRAAFAVGDPYLSEAAREALRRLALPVN
jgi:HEAT repeat protein